MSSLAREQVHHALDQERRLGPTRAAIGVGRRGVGENAVDIAGVVLDRDSSPARSARRARLARPARQSRGRRPCWRDALTRRPVIVPSRFAASLHIGDLVAPMDGRHIVLAAVLGPLDRAGQSPATRRRSARRRDSTESCCRSRRQHRATITRILFSGMPVGDADQETRDVRVLRGVPERQLVGAGTPLRHRAARLHRVGDQPLLDEALLEDNLGLAAAQPSASPLANFQWNAWLPGALSCSCGAPSAIAASCVGDDRQRLVVHLDQVERVAARCRDFPRRPPPRRRR